MIDLKVIFRKEYDPYMKIWKWLAVFPEETDWRGNMQCISFYDVKDGVMFDCHSECCPEYYHKTKTIKDKKLLDKLCDANIICEIYNDIVAGRKGKTISKYVADFFEKYGMNVKDDGIGWVISDER